MTGHASINGIVFVSFVIGAMVGAIVIYGLIANDCPAPVYSSIDDGAFKIETGKGRPVGLCLLPADKNGACHGMIQ